MDALQNILLVIAGPTASGKTDLAIRLAQSLGTVIISADSRQFYREMNIGTAKPTPEQLALVPHYFINSHSIANFYSVGDYEREVLALLNDLFTKHHVVVMVGGSGLYIRAVCQGVDDFPLALPEVKQQLLSLLATEGIVKLQELLLEKDPVYHKIVDLNNPQRLIRALEVCLSNGQPFSDFRSGIMTSRPFRMVKIGLEMERETLYNRINQRVEDMMANGLLEEAKQLYPSRHQNALQTVGYSELFDHLDGNYSLEEAVALIKRNSRRYAKRQMTWLRKESDLVWISPTEIDSILEMVDSNRQ